METPNAQPPADPGNDLLAESPSLLTTVIVGTPAGQRMLLTIRTPTTTLTLLLPKDAASTWGRQVTRAADGMSGLIAVPAPGRNGHG